ncbi:hypothetical protein EAF00_011233 [Botryotinia globosa]|nr:hypothetical protein EAF00_011233 [Botryotinia globosa]
MSATEGFGRKTREKHFSFNKQYHPLNHGSFGAFPKRVRDHQRMLQDEIESYPDTFLRYTYPELIGESRRTIAPLGVEADEVVVVPNATTGINTVLRNLMYETGGVVVYFSTIYGACAVEQLRGNGRNIKAAIFDTVVTLPGVTFPWEVMVKVCKDLGVLSLIDGAHGIGHIDLSHLGQVGPDFFVSGFMFLVDALYYMYRSETGNSDALHIAKWIEETSIKEYDTMIITKCYSGGLWARISGQIYLEMADFEWVAQRLKDLCLRVERGHWKRV